LVLHHLLLPDIATTRDLDDPDVISAVAVAVKDTRTLELLLALSLSDSRATGPSLRSKWRESLLNDLARRVGAHLAGEEHIVRDAVMSEMQAKAAEHQGLFLATTREELGYRVTVGAPDQIGLVAIVAGVLAMNRLAVRAAKVSTIGERAISEWFVRPLFGEPPAQEALYTDLTRTLAGTFDLKSALSGRAQSAASRKPVDPSATAQVRIYRVSESQVVLEVRAHDAPALLYRVASCIAREGIAVTGAKISTLGVDTVDAFFIKRADGGELDISATESLVSVLERELEPLP
jgi:[protein-PII] uridylyltransferase